MNVNDLTASAWLKRDHERGLDAHNYLDHWDRVVVRYVRRYGADAWLSWLERRIAERR